MDGYLRAMVRRRPPPGAPVVSRSTPVVAFGDPTSAEVATLGINPSWREFLDASGHLLEGDQRRLATLPWLGADRLDALTDEQVAAVVDECANYFQRNPYRRWFDPLDALLQRAVGASYYDGSACHLDLVQWATPKLWSEIKPASVRNALLDDGVPHLRAQLAQENVRLVLLNGRQVIDQVHRRKLADLAEAGQLSTPRVSYRLYTGTGEGVTWLGWSANLQSSWGISAEFKDELAAWIAQQLGPTREHGPTAAAETVELDPSGHLPRGLRVEGKQGVFAALRHWLEGSTAPTVGAVGSYGGRPGVFADIDGHEVVVNADTKRHAVEALLRDGRPDQPWQVVTNQRGQVNKVLPWPTRDLLPGWYAYLRRPLTREATI